MVNERHSRKRAGSREGFTLVELLVALAIFATVMGSVTLLFNAAVRASKQGFQNQEAFEVARGVLDLIESDLHRAFTARAHDDVFNFYGTPIGFTYVGLVDAEGSASPNLARVTYVMHQFAAAQNHYSTNVEGSNIPEQVTTYGLIRYIEPGADNLESFPVDWENESPLGLFSVDFDMFGFNTLQGMIGDPRLMDENFDGLVDTEDETTIIGEAVIFGTCAISDLDCMSELEKAAKRELWVRMLSGEAGLPNIWDTFGPDLSAPPGPDGFDPEDFVLAENFLHVDRSSANPASEADLEILGTEPQISKFDIALVDPTLTSSPTDFFFSYLDLGRNFEGEIIPIRLGYWNDRRNHDLLLDKQQKFLNDDFDNDGDGLIDFDGFDGDPNTLFDNDPDEAGGLNLGSPLDPRAPISVTIDFTLFFSSVYPGAPDFVTRFERRVDIPTAFRRNSTVQQAASP